MSAIAADEGGLPNMAQQSEEEDDEDRKYQLDPSQRLVCRFYENQYPEIEEVVMVNVRNIAEMGAYVTLLEYNNIEGMILLSELSRRRIRSVNKLIRVNRNEVVMVLRVDKEKGYIDLSKRRVSPEDIQKCEDRFNKAKAVHRVLRQVAEQKKLVLKTLYQQVGWPLYKKYGHCYDAFKLVLTEQDDIFCGMSNVETETRETLVDYIKKRLAPQPIKVRCDVEVTCFTYEGIDAVRDSLMAGQTIGTAEAPIKMKLIAPPMYVITTMTLDKDLGIEFLNKALAIITEHILKKGGKIDVKMAPKAVSQREETELQAMMERLAAENEEMNGNAEDE
jgi:translation initiation factor 2 subunit 1